MLNGGQGGFGTSHEVFFAYLTTPVSMVNVVKEVLYFSDSAMHKCSQYRRETLAAIHHRSSEK